MEVWFRLAFVIFFGCGAHRAAAAVWSFAVVGDAGVFNHRVQKVQASILRSGIKHLILAGDNLYKAGEDYETAWSSWKNQNFLFDVVTIGNHHGGYREEMSYFQMPGEYGAVVRGDIRFLVLNSDNEETAVEQAAWLEQQLEDATEKVIYIVYHHPNAIHHYYHHFNRKPKFDAAVVPVLFRYRQKISGLIGAHVHLALMAEYNDLPVIVSGATHDIRWGLPRHQKEELFEMQTHWFFDYQPYWVRLDIDDETAETTVSFVRAHDDKVSYQARIQNGQRFIPLTCSDILTRITRWLKVDR